MKKVLIVGSNGNCDYSRMYKEEGWEIVSEVEDADLLQFTGGADVSPDLYRCGKHPTTNNDPKRDQVESEFYHEAYNAGIPMVGICRGGQFLNVMNGGRMYQHVNNHAISGTHKAMDSETGHIVSVTSTHHQMMIPNDNVPCNCLLTVGPSLCDYKEYVDADSAIQIVDCKEENTRDIESIYYPNSMSLCFQPHPEYESGRKCRDYFFALIERHMFGKSFRYNNITGYYEEDYEEDE